MAKAPARRANTCGTAQPKRSWGRWHRNRHHARVDAIKAARRAAAATCDINNSCINEDGLRSHCIYLETKSEELDVQERINERRVTEYRYRYESSGTCECESGRTKNSCGPAESIAKEWGKWLRTESGARSNAIKAAEWAAKKACEGPSKSCINSNNLKSHCDLVPGTSRIIKSETRIVAGRKEYRCQAKATGKCSCV